MGYGWSYGCSSSSSIFRQTTKEETFCTKSTKCLMIACINFDYFFNTSNFCLGRPPHCHRVLPLLPEQQDLSHHWWISGEDPGPFCWLPAPVQTIVWKSWRKCSQRIPTRQEKKRCIVINPVISSCDIITTACCALIKFQQFQWQSRSPHLCYIVVGEGTCLKEIHSISLCQLWDRLQLHILAL